MTQSTKQNPHIPTSWGELADKITILQIKSERLTKPSAIENVRKELALLSAVLASELAATPKLATLQAELKTINERLWDIENDIRIKEKNKQFDAGFIELARSVYIENDNRAETKLAINTLLQSDLIEEKSYDKY